jgi:hypothetical protein
MPVERTDDGAVVESAATPEVRTTMGTRGIEGRDGVVASHEDQRVIAHLCCGEPARELAFEGHLIPASVHRAVSASGFLPHH